MSEPTRDPVGTGLSILVGVLLGVSLAASMLPRRRPGVVDVTVGPIGASLLLASVVVVALPVCLFSMYLLLAELDR